MDKQLAKSLQLSVEAFAMGKTEEANKAIHEYLCRKSQLMLMGEAAEEDVEDVEDDKDEDKDDEKKDSKDDKDDKDEDDSDEDDKDEDKDDDK